MPTRRQRKVAELIHKEISLLLQHNVRDPRLGFITVTGVDVTTDLRIAHIYVTIFDQDEIKETMQGLNSAKGYLRRELGQVLSIRHIPELTFKLDESIQHGQRIDTLLDQINEERNET